MSVLSRALMAILVGVSLGITLLVGARFMQSVESSAVPTDDDLLSEVLDEVRREYVDPIDDGALMEAAIRGMVADLDPHSQFLDADEFADIRVNATGNYSGIGVEVTLEGHDVTVIAPFRHSPAARAGIAPGDIIVAIDDRPVDGDELVDTLQRMRGEPGSLVSLSVLRSGEAGTLQFEIRREQLKILSVESRLLAPGVGYVQLSQFHEDTANELRRALNDLTRDNLTPLTGLVIDLRNNPGGLLDAAVEVADLFLDHGTIVSARGRTASARFELSAKAGSEVSEAKMIVLVNGASASAAEIVAGALQDNGRARLLGTSTFGKGLVQTVMPLSQGQAIKITTSRYFTPSGAFIQNRGITPDIVVRDEQSGAEDQQLEHALSLLVNTRLVMNDRS